MSVNDGLFVSSSIWLQVSIAVELLLTAVLQIATALSLPAWMAAQQPA